jgi:hypothetical protein
MLYDVVEVRALPEFRLWLRFEDGLEGEVDLSDMAGRGVFRRWTENPAEFLEAEVDAKSGTVVWPGALDVAPDRLYKDVLRSVDRARSA